MLASLVGILLLGIASVVVNTARAEPLPNGVPGNWALIFNEEFSANGLNTALWTPEWPREPMSGECTSPSLVSQPGNGYLYLQVRAQNSTCGGTNHPDTGSLVESNPADGMPGHSGFLYSYGYVEWHVYVVGWGGEAQGCPKGGCIPDWPALWSFPENEENEIDTMEGLRREACHTWWHHVSPVEETQGCQSGSYAGWHTYGADWEPGVLKFYYDGAQVGEVKSGYINSTAQYLIMNDVPPNGHGDQLVVPDEIVVDYVRVWRHPVPPSATTGSATSVQPLQATLNGTVNPNGFDTHYYFQYGTSTSYGSTTGEVDAGSGLSAVPASKTPTALSPGTTYHFRIAASSSTGTTYGGDQTLTTPGPVEAVSGAPTSVQQTETVLNGTVNPRGYDAKYYFQYGETTAYGASTAENDAGAGSSPVPEKGTITGLVPATIYHYRLVATSGGVISYGHDTTFSTLSAEYVFYRGPNGGLQNWYWTGGAWENGPIGSPGAVEGNPSVIVSSAGRTLGRGIIDVFYRGTDGGLQNWYWSGSSWSYAPIGPEKVMAGDPHAIALPGGHIDVFYRATNGQLQNWYWTGATWTYGPLGGENVVTGNPSAVALPESRIDVFYRATNGQLQNWYWSGSTWSYGPIGSENVVAGNPSAVALPEGHIDVFYRATDNGLQNWYWSSPIWSYNPIGAEGTMVGDPDAVAWPNGNMDVFYRGPKEVLENWFWSAPSWSFGPLGGEKVIAGEPSAVAW